MSKCIAEMNKIHNPIRRAVVYFQYIARRQLFIDGNKRTAQMVANHVLVQNGVGIFIIPDTKITEFVDCLTSYYENQDGRLEQYLIKECLIRATKSEYVYYNNDKFTVHEICSLLPKALVQSYPSEYECARANVEKVYNAFFRR